MATDIKRHITHIKSKVPNQLPTAGQIEYGEIAVNYAKGTEALSIKNNSGDIVTVKISSAITNVVYDSQNEYIRFKNSSDAEVVAIPYSSGGGSADGDIVFFGKSINSGDTNYKNPEYVWASGSQTIANQAQVRTNIGAISSSEATTLINSSISDKVSGVGITTISACTSSAYESLGTKDPNVLYVITN